MKLSERIRNYDKDIMSVLKDNPKDEWADEVAKLEAENEDIKKKATDKIYSLELENEALLKIKRAAKLYLEHGEPELADELDALLTGDQDA